MRTHIRSTNYHALKFQLVFQAVRCESKIGCPEPLDFCVAHPGPGPIAASCGVDCRIRCTRRKIKLKEAGVHIYYKDHPGQIHSFVRLAITSNKNDAGLQAVDDIAHHIHSAFELAN